METYECLIELNNGKFFIYTNKAKGVEDIKDNVKRHMENIGYNKEDYIIRVIKLINR